MQKLFSSGRLSLIVYGVEAQVLEQSLYNSVMLSFCTNQAQVLHTQRK